MVKAKKVIQEITPYETDKYFIDWDYKLDSNENFYGASDAVIEAIRNFDAKKVSLYPCYGELIDKLSSLYKVEENSILLTNGCDEALSLLISTYLDKDEAILSYKPSFSMPLLYARAQGGCVKQIDYDEKFIFNPDKFENAIDENIKIAYIATPNNPTGDVIEASALEKMIKNKPQTLFIIDCTYVNFSYSVQFEDYISLLKYKNVAVVKSFSKDFALAGLRLGFILADSEIISNLKKVSSPYNVNIVAINCAMSVLASKDKFEKIKAENKKCRDILYQNLLDLGYIPYQSEGNFILCDFKNHTDFIYEKLKRAGIIVRKYNNDTVLRITLPDIKGVEKIAELLKPRPLFVFDLDGVVFDVSKSYRQAIIKTFEYFTKKSIDESAIQKVKNQGGMSNDWKVTKYLLDEAGFNHITYEKTIEVFQSLFYDPKKPIGERGLIEQEKLVFDGEFFRELLRSADCAVFTSREAEEAFYSHQKFDVKKYFNYFITAEVVGENPKPSPFGLEVIKKHCPYTEIHYFGDTIDDIKAGLGANVSAYGIIPPNAASIDETTQKLIETGAKLVFKNKNEILKADLINKKEEQCV